MSFIFRLMSVRSSKFATVPKALQQRYWRRISQSSKPSYPPVILLTRDHLYNIVVLGVDVPKRSFTRDRTIWRFEHLLFKESDYSLCKGMSCTRSQVFIPVRLRGTGGFVAHGQATFSRHHSNLWSLHIRIVSSRSSLFGACIFNSDVAILSSLNQTQAALLFGFIVV